MCNCVFSFANNYLDYKNLINKNIDFIFTDKKYDDFCINLNKKINLYDCFIYLNGYKKQYKYYLYFSSKGRQISDLSILLNNNNLYLNYYGDTIYLVKYDYFLFELYKLCKSNFDDFVFLNFLSDYFSSFNHNINKNLSDKFVFPKNKFVYNVFYLGNKNEKLKHKKD
jgi:hypothetical protein